MSSAQAHIDEIGSYPDAWEFDALLIGGSSVCVRPIRPADAPLLVSFHTGLSQETLYHRYFSIPRAFSIDDAARLASVDYLDRMAFVAVVAGRLVGLASFDRLTPGGASAEVAFVVVDEAHRQGVATLLFEGLAAYARNVGIGTFVAEVLSDNREMLEVFGSAGLEYRRVLEGGTVRLDIDLRPTVQYVARCDAREAVAEAASIAPILRPKSIAVVGAGRTPGNAGHEVVRSLLAGDFTGRVYPVNPRASAVCGVPAFPSLSALPEVVDLAVVAVRSDAVPEIVKEAAAVGVRAVLIITSGFGETGADGAALEAEMLDVARRHGMRIVGPNCLGVINTDPTVRMNATFADLELSDGRVALVSQSGAVGVALAREARHGGLGLSSFVSVGNKLDVSSNDLLCFLEGDESTGVVALYLESFGNPRKFSRIARRVAQRKPIVALVAGRSVAGARGARSHTAAAATPNVVVSALLEYAGVIKVDHLEELVDVSRVLLSGKLPAGPSVALVGNSGGPLILAADACEECGLIVPRLGDATVGALAELAGPNAAVANPVDLTADASARTLERALELVDADESLDAAIVVVTELPALSAVEVTAVVERRSTTTEKPMVVCVLGTNGAPAHASDEAGYATLVSPERAANALARVAWYAKWRRDAQAADQVRISPEIDFASPFLARSLGRHPDGGWLDLDEGADLLTSWGLPVLETRAAANSDEAVAAATELGYPVALKARNGSIVHKSELGGVQTGLADAGAVRAAYKEVAERLGDSMGGAVVQPTASAGVETIVGIAADPTFGPVVMVGMGGVASDLIGDRAFAVPPLATGAAAAMVASLRTSPLLDGYRGSPPVDRPGLVRLVESLAMLAAHVPEVVELDCNPVLVRSSDVTHRRLQGAAATTTGRAWSAVSLAAAEVTRRRTRRASPAQEKGSS